MGRNSRGRGGSARASAAVGGRGGQSVEHAGRKNNGGRNGRSDKNSDKKSFKKAGKDGNARARSGAGRAGAHDAASGSHVRAKKHLGQHFLTDLSIAQRIADSLDGGSAANPVPVLEVGPGMGVLTQFLLKRDDIATYAAEIDTESIEYLREHFPQLGDRLIPGDFLNMDLQQVFFGCDDHADCDNSADADDSAGFDDIADCDTRAGCNDFSVSGNAECTDHIKCTDHLEYTSSPANAVRRDLPARHGLPIIGNFPYNISSQIFFKVLDNRDLVPQVVCMVQREVAQRIAEPPGSRQYGILSVLLQAWYDIEYLFTVSENVFDPPPKVKSAVIRLRRNSVRELGCDERLFVRVVKAAFGQRRKMLRNALRAAFGDFSGAEHPLFSTRAEQLDVAQFVELTQWVDDHK